MAAGSSGTMGLRPPRLFRSSYPVPSAPASRPIRFHACSSGSLPRTKGGQGKGVGSGLLKHALERCVTASGLIGGRALVVNAVDDGAATFWRRWGFLPSKDDPLTLFRSISDIAASLGTPQQ